MTQEEKLLQCLKEGDESAYEQLFKDYYPKLCAYCNHIVKDRAIAEEIVADLFLYIWENCDTLTINTSLKSYLFQSVHNKSLKHLRKLAVELKYTNSLTNHYNDLELHQSQSYHYPIANLIAQELTEKIENAISALPDQCRTIFQLHREEEISYKEIADQLNVSVNTVKTQMSRALQKLRTALAEFLPIILFVFASQ